MLSYIKGVFPQSYVNYYATVQAIHKTELSIKKYKLTYNHTQIFMMVLFVLVTL